MGKSCCKLIVHTFKSSITIRSKVNQLYLLQAGTNEEFHANLQAQKLMKYLESRNDKIQSCVKLIDKRWKTAVEGVISREAMSVLNITLHALKHLSDLREFLFLTNSLCFHLLSQSSFSDTHSLVIEVLELCINKHLEDQIPYAENNLICLLERPDNKPQALLIGKLSYVIGEEINDPAWDKVLELAFHWAFQGDLDLIESLATFMYEHANNYDRVIQFFYNYKWKERSVSVFSSILGSRNKLSEFAKSMVQHLEFLVNENRLVETPCRCLLVLLQEAQPPLQTLFPMSKFKTVLEAIMTSLSFELAREIMLEWYDKAYSLGVFLLIKEFLIGESIEKPQKQCLNILIEFIDTHKMNSVAFRDRILGLIDELLACLIRSQNLVHIKYIGVFLKLYYRKPHRHEINKINSYLIRTLENLGSFDEASKYYKYSLRIWLLFVKIKPHYKTMLALVVKLRDHLEQSDRSHNRALGVCMSIIIKEMAMKHPRLSELAQNTPIHPEIAEYGKIFDNRHLSQITKKKEIYRVDMFPIEKYEQVELFDPEFYIEKAQLPDILGSFDDSDRSSIKSEERHSLTELKQSAQDYFNVLMAQEDERLDLVNKILQS